MESQIETKFSFNTYPNPFTNHAHLDYEIQTSGYLNISVFNTSGEKKMELINENNHPTGNYTVTLDGRNFSAGLYLIIVTTDSGTISKQIVKLQPLISYNIRNKSLFVISGRHNSRNSMIKTGRRKFLHRIRLIFSLCFLMVHFDSFAQDYYPMNLGNTWIFDFLDTNGNTTGKDSMVINDNYSLMDLNVFLLSEYFTPPVFFNDSILTQVFDDTIVSNDVYILELDTTIWKQFQHQYNDGDLWFTGSDSVKVSYLGLVTVPAGSFNSCYYVYSPTGFGAGVGVGYVCAPDVGVIKSIAGGFDYAVLVSYSITLGINSPNIMDDIVLYPNPTTGQFTVEMDLQGEIKLSIELYHFTGQLICSEVIGNVTGSYTQQIDLSRYAKGIYYVQILTEQGVLTRKVIYH